MINSKQLNSFQSCVTGSPLGLHLILVLCKLKATELEMALTVKINNGLKTSLNFMHEKHAVANCDY